ncbi:hypothetical protein GE09DRAFT_1089509 [Coniochaeta sp. 2T2.1]|nr:hypothetical protein GE09DRAFT_1089509 [Coniochaeta sp. 2T2.1]
MSSIGPQLPPHLQKRKRSEDDNAPDSPPAKTMRPANNTDEIDLADDSSDDDSYGPSAGPAPAKAPQHGPSLPSPSTKPTTPPCPSTIGPSMPPPSAAIGPSMPPPSQQAIGPTPPPASLSSLPPQPPSDSGSDSDSEDDYGPSLPTSTSHLSRISSLPSPSFSSSSATVPPKRDDWMLAPPTAAPSYSERDPTKLKARKFATGRAAAGNEAHSGGVSAIWTETPEEKAKRLRDAVLGRGGEAAEGGQRKGREEKVVAAPKGGETADERKIREFTEQTRGRSLYEEHQARKNRRGEGEEGKGGKAKGEGEEEEDDPSKRAFNWEKDMKSGGTISHTQRRQLLAKSADFGGRFDKGRYL